MSILVPPLQPPERLDLFLSRSLGLTRAKVRHMLDGGNVRVNGKAPEKAGIKLKGGERIEYSIPEEPPLDLKREAIPLSILFEDDSLLAIDKPPGLVVHPAAGHWEGTLVNALLYHFDRLSGIDPARPGIVHRLDKDTSGVLIIAKNDAAHLELSRQFKDREMVKIYAALVHGAAPANDGTIDKPIGRHPKERKKMAVVESGRHAITRYKISRRWKNFTLLECRIETGRTHQIRVHLSSIGHPVAGDPLYGKFDRALGAERQMLHAWKMRLKHPLTGEPLDLEAPLPADFTALIRKLDEDPRERQ